MRPFNATVVNVRLKLFFKATLWSMISVLYLSTVIQSVLILFFNSSSQYPSAPMNTSLATCFEALSGNVAYDGRIKRICPQRELYELAEYRYVTILVVVYL